MASPSVRPTNASPATPVAMTETGIKTVRTMLEQMRNQIQMALPKQLSVDKMIRVSITSVQKNEKLLECAPVTLIGAIVQLAQLGLEPDDGTGKAYLIPFWNGKKQRMEVQAMAGYRGLVQLARNSGEVRDVIPHEVYSADTFSYQFGTEQILTHIPYDGKGERGELTHVYAIATYKDNGKPSFDVMTVAQVEEIHQKVMEKNRPKSGKNRDGSPWKESGPWVDHYDEMAKKTVVRRLCKHLPSSPELQKAVALDEKADFAIPQDLGSLILPEQEKSSESVEAPPAPQRLSEAKKETAVELIDNGERNKIVELLEDNGMTMPDLVGWLKDVHGIAGTDQIPKAKYMEVCKFITEGPEIPFGK